MEDAQYIFTITIPNNGLCPYLSNRELSSLILREVEHLPPVLYKEFICRTIQHSYTSAKNIYSYSSQTGLLVKMPANWNHYVTSTLRFQYPHPHLYLNSLNPNSPAHNPTSPISNSVDEYKCG